MRNRVALAWALALALASCEPTGWLTVSDRGVASLKIVVARDATDGEKDAAAELARCLHESSGVAFDVAQEGDSATGLFVGRTELAKAWRLPPADAGDEGYAIRVRRAQGKAVIVGGSDMATKFAVYDFLDRFVGARWFIPGELFEIIPKHETLAIPDVNLVERPAFSPRAFWPPRLYGLGDLDPQLKSERWYLRNRLSADGRGMPGFFSHNLYQIVSPDKYGKTHPEYFPLRNGKRYIPESARDQNWQPCTTNPDVIRLAVEWGRNFFAKNPEPWKWLSLGINDGAGWCECEGCKALDVPGRTFRHRAVIASDRHYCFVRQVADVLLKEFPDRKIGVIAYASVEPRPEKIAQLPPNVCVYITHDSSQYHDSEYLKQDLEFDKIWLAVSNRRLYRYDYYGLTWFVPRYFPHLIADDARRMKAMGVRGLFTEACPAWPTVGPMLYVAAKSLWDPADDPDKRLEEFYSMCFGKAAGPIRKFWERHERLWMQDRPGTWFEGLGDLRPQVALYTQEDLDYCGQQLEDAMRLADDALVEERIRAFVPGWTLASDYIREHLLLTRMGKAESAEDRLQTATDVLLAVAQRHKFWETFKQDKGFFCAAYKYFLEGLHRDGNWETFVESKAHAALFDSAGQVAKASPDGLAGTIEKLRNANVSAATIEVLETARLLAGGRRPANLLQNPAFAPGQGSHPKGEGWSAQGAPAGWSTWRLSKGDFRFKDGVASVRGSDNGVVIQSIPVKPGEKVMATVRYRASADPPARAILVLRWRQADGGWLESGPDKRQGVHMVSVECPKSNDWRDAFAFAQTPEGATQAVFMIGAKDQKPDDVTEFYQPYFAKR